MIVATNNGGLANRMRCIASCYKFSENIPMDYTWHSIKTNNDFMPTFTKKIFKQVSVLF